MNGELRVRPTAGLAAIVVAHAAILASVLIGISQPSGCVAPTPQQTVQQTDTIQLPQYNPLDERMVTQPIELPAVNEQAQSELKQQILRWRRYTVPAQPCQPCQPAPSRVVVKPKPTAPSPPKPGSPSVPPDFPDAGDEEPLVLNEPDDGPVTLPMVRWQMAAFLDDSDLSNRVKSWLETHPGLKSLREQCEWQVYAPDNPLYKTRFAGDVPTDAFPVVVLQDHTGGHVHVASRNNLPSSAEELYRDFARGYELYKQAKQAVITGVIDLKADGISWDEAIEQQTTPLAPGDCPDGFCPVDQQPALSPTKRPGQRIRDLLFPARNNPANALIWADGSEIATMILAATAAGLLALLIRKRMYA